ncbi:MAG: DUF169 domain-containing protein [Candidatus Hodarchaeales archaeon]
MAYLTLNEVCNKLKKAGRLTTQPLYVYGTDVPPIDSKPSIDIKGCFANVVYSLATESEYSTVHLTTDNEKRSCPGAQAWIGYKPLMSHLKYTLSTGSKDFRSGRSEFLIANPNLTEKRLQAVGKIAPLGKYTIISKKYNFEGEITTIKSILCFGNSQQIRNLCSLFYFQSEKSYGIQIPWGPSCSSFISYPAGIIENGPQNCIILGPTDPTGNRWLSENFMSIGIPFEIARQMAEDVDSSFITKHPRIAYP